MKLTINGIESDYWIDGGLTQIINSGAPVSGAPSVYLGALVYAPFGPGCYYLYFPGQDPMNLGNNYYAAKQQLYVLVKQAGKFPIP